jgi:replicative DNA helicase/5S rRNA maturation endonuclease (ribonuclease M5)
VEIVEEDTFLKKSGKQLKGKCPFHDDNSPSFTVYPNTGDFHCFGCGVNGTVVDYIMLRLNTKSPSEALNYVSSHYGLALSNFDKEKYETRKKMISKKRSEASTYFKEFKKAAEFMKDRKISEATAKLFGIGFDTERKALAIPFLNTYGEVVGTSFRFFNDDGPKYINESETEIFKKSELLYGLDKARKHIKKHVYIVEGYFDVLALHDMGIPSVVAYCGSSLTEEQISLLSNYITKETKVYLVPDNDSTGMKEVHKNIEKIQRKLPNRVGIIELPEGIKDANDLLAAEQNITDIKSTHVLLFKLRTELDKCLDKEDEYEVAIQIAKKTRNEMLKQEMVRYLAKRWNESVEIVSKHIESGVPSDSLIDDIYGFTETFIDFQKRLREGDKSFIQTGYAELDKRIPRSLRKKEMVYVMGRSGSGKTTFAVNLAYNAVFHQRKNVAVFSIELDRTAILPQFIQIHKNWPEKRAEKFALDQEEYDDDLKEMVTRFEEHVKFVDKEGISLEDIEKYIQVMNTHSFKNPVDLVIIDYFGMIKLPGKKDSYTELSDQARGLKEMAKRLDCTVVCLSQANRKGGKDGSEPLTLEAARDTGAIEESADYVLGVYRPGLSPDSLGHTQVIGDKEIRVQVLKARWGIVGETLLHFDGRTKLISDWPDNLPRMEEKDYAKQSNYRKNE